MYWNVTVMFSRSEAYPELCQAEHLEEPYCQDHDIAVYRANIRCCVTLLCGMLQMQDDPSVGL